MRVEQGRNGKLGREDCENRREEGATLAKQPKEMDLYSGDGITARGNHYESHKDLGNWPRTKSK